MRPVLLMLRHGETQLNAKDAFRGWKNVPLNDDGIRQAKEAGRFLKRFPITLVVHSPLERTFETAKLVMPHMPIEPDYRLLPWNIGILAGKPKKNYLPVRDYYLDHPDRVIPKGESINDFQKRFKEVLDLGLSYGSHKGIPLFVTHTSNVVAAENLLNKGKGRPEDTESVEPGGIAAVYRQGDGFVVKPIFKASKQEDVPS